MDCKEIRRFLQDEDVNVASLAATAAAKWCKGHEETVSQLAAIAALPAVSQPPAASREPPAARPESPAANRPPAAGPWHRRAHALVALATLDADRAVPLVEAASQGEPWQVRMYAARACAPATDATRPAAVAVLRRLAEDTNDNVREAVVTGLSTLVGHDADAVYRANLGRDDGQLVIAAASALAKSPEPAVNVPVLLAALERLTAQRRETSRDPRLAIVDRLAEQATPGDAPRLERWLRDFDPRVASAVAGVLTRLTGARVEPAPEPLPRAPLPTDADLDRMASARVTLTVRGRGDVTIRLRPDEAPLNAFRFLRLAERGFYTGLTFHRVVPGFVVQGGSPGANEFSGDGPFSRDEVGLLSNLRGSVGLSTRGRDTGDGQFYVNLVDNVRLDHTYTVFAQVESGLDVVDRLVEGDVIEKVTVRP